MGLQDSIRKLVDAADKGPYFLGESPSLVDVEIAPWIIRFTRVLKPYRGWDLSGGSRWAAWVNAIENDEHVMATTSDDKLYLDSYQRYARESEFGGEGAVQSSRILTCFFFRESTKHVPTRKRYQCRKTASLTNVFGIDIGMWKVCYLCKSYVIHQSPGHVSQNRVYLV